MPFPRVSSTGSSGGGSSTPADGSVTDVKVAANAAIAAAKIAGTAVTQADTGTVTSAMILDGTIVTGDLSATAGITSGQLAGSIAPSKITGTAITAADTGTVTSAMILDGTIVTGDISATAGITGAQLSSTVAIPSGATATSQSAADNSTKLATTLYADRSVNLARNGMWSAPTGAVAQTMDRSVPTGTTRTLATATLYLNAIYIPTGTVVSNFNCISSATTSSGTHCWMALFDNSRVQLATSADDTSVAAFTANATKTQAVATIASGASATFTTTYSGLHYVGVCWVGTGTAPTLNCVNRTINIAGLAPILCGSSNTSQTTPNAFAFTATALTVTNNHDYMWLT